MAKAKESTWRVWSEDLNTAAGQNKMFKMTEQMRKDRKGVLGTVTGNFAIGYFAVRKFHHKEISP